MKSPRVSQLHNPVFRSSTSVAHRCRCHHVSTMLKASGLVFLCRNRSIVSRMASAISLTGHQFPIPVDGIYHTFLYPCLGPLQETEAKDQSNPVGHIWRPHAIDFYGLWDGWWFQYPPPSPSAGCTVSRIPTSTCSLELDVALKERRGKGVVCGIRLNISEEHTLPTSMKFPRGGSSFL